MPGSAPWGAARGCHHRRHQAKQQATAQRAMKRRKQGVRQRHYQNRRAGDGRREEREARATHAAGARGRRTDTAASAQCSPFAEFGVGLAKIVVVDKEPRLVVVHHVTDIIHRLAAVELLRRGVRRTQRKATQTKASVRGAAARSGGVSLASRAARREGGTHVLLEEVDELADIGRVGFVPLHPRHRVFGRSAPGSWRVRRRRGFWARHPKPPKRKARRKWEQDFAGKRT